MPLRFRVARVRPWKPPSKAMMARLPVAARATFRAFSAASAPLLVSMPAKG
ncbi:hypothetical protein D3C78_1906760 [compost metagenome]